LIGFISGRARHPPHRLAEHAGREVLGGGHLRCRGEGNATEVGEQFVGGLIALRRFLREAAAYDRLKFFRATAFFFVDFFFAAALIAIFHFPRTVEDQTSCRCRVRL